MGKNIFTFSSFASSSLVHGISSRSLGDIKSNKGVNRVNLNNFLEALNIKGALTISMQQTHSAHVSFVTSADCEEIKDSDGLVTSAKNIFLYTVTADCLPLLFWDKKKGIIGVAHAGYKGILKGIILQILQTMQKAGADIKDIRVGIGPGIHVCCYTVPLDRIAQFKNKFPRFTNMIEEKDSQYFLNLPSSAYQQLTAYGLPPSQIEQSPLCTKCNSDIFFSYRSDTSQTYGQFATIIGML